MNEYLVSVPEVWVQVVLIEAESEEDALQLVKQGNGENLEDQFEYSHTLDDGWTSHKLN